MVWNGYAIRRHNEQGHWFPCSEDERSDSRLSFELSEPGTH